MTRLWNWKRETRMVPCSSVVTLSHQLRHAMRCANSSSDRMVGQVVGLIRDFKVFGKKFHYFALFVRIGQDSNHHPRPCELMPVAIVSQILLRLAWWYRLPVGQKWSGQVGLAAQSVDCTWQRDIPASLEERPEWKALNLKDHVLH